MNKMVKVSLAGLAAAAMIIPASANTTWYGRANYEIQSKMDGEYIDGVANASRLGVRGSQDLDNGLKAVFMFESSVNTDNSGGAFAGRQAWTGIQGDFGTLTLGHQNDAFQGMLGNLNNWSLADVDVSTSTNMAGMGFQPFSDGRTSKAIKFAGKADDLSYAISFAKEVDTTPGDEETVFAPALAVRFTGVENLDLRFGYRTKDDGDYTQIALTALYSMGDLKVGFGFDTITQDIAGTDVDLTTMLIPVEYNLGNGLSVNAALVRWDLDGNVDDININVGVKKNLGQRTWAYASVASFGSDGEDRSDWGIGIRHDF
ncbi:porin [Desulfurispirillum indicum]|uniref:porin n=1 Tax=Desulfurispirillum indicum TaxID=936456 RepID=UPI001CF94F0E|nr:porin [Desulfurispirillum indicum]UCZ57164.1 porin [Desulfurispirillum indicum]